MENIGKAVVCYLFIFSGCLLADAVNWDIQITARYSETALLPCGDITPFSKIYLVQWFKSTDDTKYVNGYDAVAALGARNGAQHYSLNYHITDDLFLQVTNVTVSNNGIYRCKVFFTNEPDIFVYDVNLIGINMTLSNNISVVPLFHPARIACNQPLLENELISVEWFKSENNANFLNPGGAVAQWKQGDHSVNLPNYDIGSAFSLVIHNLTSESEGLYRCKATSRDLQQVFAHDVKIYPFAMTLSNDISVAPLFHPARIACNQPLLENELISVEWFKSENNSNFLNPGGAVAQWKQGHHSVNSPNYDIGSAFSLVIHNLTSESEGLYRCKATSRDLRQVFAHDVKIYPFEPFAYENVNGRAGSSTTFSCRHQVLPEYVHSVRWFKSKHNGNVEEVIAIWKKETGDRKHFSDNYTMTDNFSLIKNYVTASDAATYRCSICLDDWRHIYRMVDFIVVAHKEEYTSCSVGEQFKSSFVTTLSLLILLLALIFGGVAFLFARPQKCFKVVTRLRGKCKEKHTRKTGKDIYVPTNQVHSAESCLS